MSVLKPLGIFSFCVMLGVVVLLGLSLPADVRGTSGDADEADEEVSEITSDQCRSAWSDSDATWTCTWNSFGTNDENDKCVVSADCRYSCARGNPTRCQWLSNNLTVSLDDVGNLNNCHGTLTVGAC